MTTANIGYGSKLAYSSDDAAYTNVIQEVDINGPDISVDAVAVTNQDSTNGFKEFIPGLGDGGNITCNFVYVKTAVTALSTLIRATKYWRITLTDSSTWKCQGFITKLASGTPLEDKLTFDLEIKLTGKPTFAAG